MRELLIGRGGVGGGDFEVGGWWMVGGGGGRGFVLLGR